MRKLLLGINLFIGINCSAQFIVKTPSDSIDINAWIASKLCGSGIVIKNVDFKGNIQSIGEFVSTNTPLDFNSGLILSTGIAEQAVGPNNRTNAGANFGDHFFSLPDIPELTKACDGSVITIDFIPTQDSISLSYLFASEEYPEFVQNDFNDYMAIRIALLDNNEPMQFQNLALTKDKQRVCISSINNTSNSEVYIENHLHTSAFYNHIEFDGLTHELKAGTGVIPGKMYRMQIILADVGDCEYDSGIMLQLNSFCSTNNSYNAKQNGSNPPIRLLLAYDQKNALIPSPESLNEIKFFAESVNKIKADSITIISFLPETGKRNVNIKLCQNRNEVLQNLIMQHNLNATLVKRRIMKSARSLNLLLKDQKRAPKGFAEILLFSH